MRLLCERAPQVAGAVVARGGRQRVRLWVSARGGGASAAVVPVG